MQRIAEKRISKPQKHMPIFIESHELKNWTQREYKMLIQLIKEKGEDWRAISRLIATKTPLECKLKFKKSQTPVKRGNWTLDEDDRIREWVAANGRRKWAECSELINMRCGKQCRERWINVLDPNVKKGNWSKHELDTVFEKLRVFGTSWSKITFFLENRNENSVKNKFNSTLRKMKSSLVGQYLRDVFLYNRPQSASLLFELKSYNKFDYLGQLIFNVITDREKVGSPH